MKLFSVLYSIFLVFFSLQTFFLILASSHRIDFETTIIYLVSGVALLCTAYFLYKYDFSKPKTKNLVGSLFFTIIIFGYHTCDVIIKGDTQGVLIYLLLIGFFSALFFFLYIFFSKRKTSSNKV